MAVQLAILDTSAEMLWALEAPTDTTQDMQDHVDLLGVNVGSAAEAFADGLDNLDLERFEHGVFYIEQATVNLQDVTAAREAICEG